MNTSFGPSPKQRSERELLEENLLLTRQLVAQQHEGTTALREALIKMLVSPVALQPMKLMSPEQLRRRLPGLLEALGMSSEELERRLLSEGNSPLPLRAPPPDFQPSSSKPDDTDR
jgi:hypothetical protein